MTTITQNARGRSALALACIGAVAAALAAVPATAAPSARGVDGLLGARGLDIAHGRMVVADSSGAISEVVRRGPDKGTTEKVGKVAKGFGSAVAIAPNGDVWAVTGGPHGTVYIFREGRPRRAVVDLGAWQKKNNKDPFGIEGKPGESNAFGITSLDDG
ncbi:MAG: hypothetical protein WBQ50_17120, partial [Nocardioides sp.]